MSLQEALLLSLWQPEVGLLEFFSQSLSQRCRASKDGERRFPERTELALRFRQEDCFRGFWSAFQETKESVFQPRFDVGVEPSEASQNPTVGSEDIRGGKPIHSPLDRNSLVTVHHQRQTKGTSGDGVVQHILRLSSTCSHHEKTHGPSLLLNPATQTNKRFALFDARRTPGGVKTDDHIRSPVTRALPHPVMQIEIGRTADRTKDQRWSFATDSEGSRGRSCRETKKPEEKKSKSLVHEKIQRWQGNEGQG
jgi:hypothetical protein